MQRINYFPRKEVSQHPKLFAASDKKDITYEKIFLFSALLIIACGQAEATCNIKDIAKGLILTCQAMLKYLLIQLYR